MKVRLFFIAIVMVALVFLPGIAFAAFYSAYAFKALHWANTATGTSREITTTSQRQVSVATEASTRCDGSGEQALQATEDVYLRLDALVLQLHLIAMERMGVTLDHRLDAAEGVTDALYQAWNLGFLKSCNLDSPELTLDAFMVQFLEQTQCFHLRLFKYIYYDEPNPVDAAQWTECGWSSSSLYTFYAMGNDQRYIYWGADPKVSSQQYLWKDDDESVDGTQEYFDGAFRGATVAWDSSVYLDNIDGFPNSPALLYTRMVATMDAGNVKGSFGVDMDMGFLSSTLQRSLISPSSSAFIFDLARNCTVLAHTFEELPLFTNGSSSAGLVPFLVDEFPSPLVQACVAELVSSFGSLVEVPTNTSEFLWNGTVYLYSTMVFLRRGLHWLSCQLTPKDHFEGKISSSSDKLSAVISEGRASRNDTWGLQQALIALSESTDARMEQTAETTTSVQGTVVQFVAMAGVLMVGCFVFVSVVGVLVGRTVRKLSRQMSRVAAMQLEGLQPMCSRSVELDHLQRSFAMMVKSLESYKSFLPVGVTNGPNAPMSPDSLGDDVRLPWTSSSAGFPVTPTLVDASASSFLDGSVRRVVYVAPPSPKGLPLRYGAVLCINHVGTHRLSRHHSATFAHTVAELVAMMKSAIGEGIPTTFFGDQLVAFYEKSGHCTAAVQAAQKLLGTALVARFRFAMGISYGRVMAGPMGIGRA
eukprot:RCo017750